MRPTLLLCGLLLGSAARAGEPSPPPVMPTEVAEPALPPEFLDQALKVDVDNRITRGRAQAPLTHRELFQKLGRADLLAKSDGMLTRRRWLIVGAVGLSTAAIVAGSILIATAPNLATPACENSVQVYNEICVPRANQHNISGTAIIVGGVVGALLMAGFAYGSDPAVLTRDETVSLVGTYNSQLARQLRRPPAGLRLLPMVTPDGASLTASLRF
ncbi:MAG: hypothetical protein Q8L48_22460 [Archangium sp.]|nr:hypothetical protein [Archangium sp.]